MEPGTPRLAVGAPLVHFVRVKAGRWIAGAAVAVVLLGACAVEPGVATESAQHLDAPITPSTPRLRADRRRPADPRPVGHLRRRPNRPTRPTRPIDRPDGAEQPDDDRTGRRPRRPARLRGRQDAPGLRRLPRGRADRHRGVVERGVPEGVRRAVRADRREDLRRLPGAHDRRSRAASRSKPTTYDEIAQFSAFYCAAGRLHGLRRRTRRPARPAHRELRIVDPRRRVRPRVRPRGAVARRRRSTASCRRSSTEQQADCFAGAWVAHAASGSGGRHVQRRRRAQRPRRDDPGPRSGGHRSVHRRAATARPSIGSAPSRPASPRASSVVPS